MAKDDEAAERNPQGDDLFDEIRDFLASQSGEDIYEELSRAYKLASSFADRELKDRVEYARMLRGIERLVSDVMGSQLTPAVRGQIAELLYLYGLAHYSILQQIGDDEHGDEEESRIARPLIVYDVWFPSNIGVEVSDDGYYLHVGDGRIDISIYLGEVPDERNILGDLVNHWEFAAASSNPALTGPDLSGSVPVLAIEMDYAGSELIDAGDHVDILFYDHRGEPFIRIHARDSDLRAMVDEIQAVIPGSDL